MEALNLAYLFIYIYRSIYIYIYISYHTLASMKLLPRINERMYIQQCTTYSVDSCVQIHFVMTDLSDTDTLCHLNDRSLPSSRFSTKPAYLLRNRKQRSPQRNLGTFLCHGHNNARNVNTRCVVFLYLVTIVQWNPSASLAHPARCTCMWQSHNSSHKMADGKGGGVFELRFTVYFPYFCP